MFLLVSVCCHRVLAGVSVLWHSPSLGGLAGVSVLWHSPCLGVLAGVSVLWHSPSLGVLAGVSVLWHSPCLGVLAVVSVLWHSPSEGSKKYLNCNTSFSPRQLPWRCCAVSARPRPSSQTPTSSRRKSTLWRTATGNPARWRLTAAQTAVRPHASESKSRQMLLRTRRPILAASPRTIFFLLHSAF